MDSSSDIKYVSKLVPQSQMWLAVLIVGTSFIDSVMTGYDSSLMGSLNVMPSYESYFTLSTATYSLNTGISYVGGVFGALFAGTVSDLRGRRQAMLLATAITFVGGVLQAASVHISMFIIARFILGVGLAVAATACPTYVAECARPSYRSFAMGLYYSCWGIGTLIASGVCYGTADWASTWAWRLPSLLQIVPSMVAATVIMFVPESPRWLIKQDRQDEALEVLALINSGGDKQDTSTLVQFREICDTIHWEVTEGGQQTFRQAWTNPINRKRITIAASYSVIVMLCGNNIITYYFGDMLKQAGITNPKTQLVINIILTVWSLLISVVASWYADFFPRKVLCCLGLALFSLFIYMLGGLSAAFGDSSNTSGIYAVIAMIFLCKGAYSFGVNPLTVLYPAEILSYQIRATGMGLYTLTTKISGLISTMASPFALRNIGWKTYMIFGSADIIMIILVSIYWVETRGLTLEEVDAKFHGVKHSDVPDLKEVEGKTPELIEGLKQKSMIDGGDPDEYSQMEHSTVVTKKA